MIIVGILLLLIGFLLIISYLISIIKCRTETKAVIEKIIEKKYYFRGRNVKYCTPVFAYTINDKKYTSKADFFTLNSKKYFVGQEIIVFTNAKHPEKVRYGSNIRFCTDGIILSALGVFIIILTLM